MVLDIIFFQKQGFEVVVCPWQNPESIAVIGIMVSKHGPFDLLATTWYMEHGTMLVHQLCDSANAAWRGKARCQEDISPLLPGICARSEVTWELMLTISRDSVPYKFQNDLASNSFHLYYGSKRPHSCDLFDILPDKTSSGKRNQELMRRMRQAGKT